jgi:AcrR family transcriptional regulator
VASTAGNHFGGKEALMNEAVAETTRAWTRSIEAEVWKDGTERPAEHLRRMLAYEDVRVAGAAMLEHLFESADRPIGPAYARELPA